MNFSSGTKFVHQNHMAKTRGVPVCLWGPTTKRSELIGFISLSLTLVTWDHLHAHGNCATSFPGLHTGDLVAWLLVHPLTVTEIFIHISILGQLYNVFFIYLKMQAQSGKRMPSLLLYRILFFSYWNRLTETLNKKPHWEHNKTLIY